MNDVVRQTPDQVITLVEQHIIKANDPRYAAIDAAAFAAKNLYNLANYQVRQTFLLPGVG